MWLVVNYSKANYRARTLSPPTCQKASIFTLKMGGAALKLNFYNITDDYCTIYTCMYMYMYIYSFCQFKNK